MKKIRKSPLLPKKWAQELKEKLLKQYSQKHIEQIYNDLLGGFFSL